MVIKRSVLNTRIVAVIATLQMDGGDSEEMLSRKMVLTTGTLESSSGDRSTPVRTDRIVFIRTKPHSPFEDAY